MKTRNEEACFDFELEWLRRMALPMNRNRSLNGRFSKGRQRAWLWTC